MIRLVYNLLFPLGLLFFLPGYLRKMRRRGNYRRNFGQRFGFYGKDVLDPLPQQRPTWIHAVSVGEVAIALKLAARLRELEPDFHGVLTTATTTGFAVAEREAGDRLRVMYNPLDFWPIVRRAFATIRPKRIVLVEAEVWPNLAACARARGIPLALVNARLSPRSERRFRRFRALVAPTFCCLDLVCVQERKDVERWASLGVRREVIKVVGSIKYDPEETGVDTPLALRVLRSCGIGEGRPVLFGGSTHPGEEEILATVFLRLRAEFPSLLLIIAPRHVERTPKILEILQARGLRTALRSAVEQNAGVEPDCLLLDTTGELRNWYAVATVVFVGKSLIATGGQNPVEPILAGKPVIFGPHMVNFASLVDSLLAAGGAVQADNGDALELKVMELLHDPKRRDRMVQNSLQVLAKHRGATERTAELIVALQPRRDGG